MPVLRRPKAKPSALECPRQTQRRRLPDAAGGDCIGPIWIRPRKNVPVVSTTDPQPNRRPSDGQDRADMTVDDIDIIGFGLDDDQFCCSLITACMAAA